MTRPSTTKLVEEVLENLDKLKMSGTLLKVARPRIHVSGLEVSDSENRLALFKSPQLIHKFKDFLALAPQIFYDNDKKYVKALIIRKDGKDILYKFPTPKKSLVSKKPTKHELPKKSPAMRDRQSLRSYTGRSELVNKDRIHSGMGPKMWAAYQKLAKEFGGEEELSEKVRRRMDKRYENTEDIRPTTHYEVPDFTAEDNARFMYNTFRQYRPSPPEVKTRSGLPSLPTAGTGWLHNYTVEAGPDNYVPKGRPRNNGTWEPFKADYQTYNYEQTYTPDGYAYTHALGSEESKDTL